MRTRSCGSTWRSRSGRCATSWRRARSTTARPSPCRRSSSRTPCGTRRRSRFCTGSWATRTRSWNLLPQPSRTPRHVRTRAGKRWSVSCARWPRSATRSASRWSRSRRRCTSRRAGSRCSWSAQTSASKATSAPSSTPARRWRHVTRRSRAWSRTSRSFSSAQRRTRPPTTRPPSPPPPNSPLLLPRSSSRRLGRSHCATRTQSSTQGPRLAGPRPRTSRTCRASPRRPRCSCTQA
mmetsp:Transcript_2980/g.6966  ORF Transcript_2980/g.6966 Transcript_2980/m.6966 type:complete len:236 (+) Transcript_2980:3660-4367(+)